MTDFSGIFAKSRDAHTAVELSAAIQIATADFKAAEGELTALQALAVSPMTSAGEAEEAEAGCVTIGLRKRRLETALAALNDLLTEHQHRERACREVAEREAALMRLETAKSALLVSIREHGARVAAALAEYTDARRAGRSVGLPIHTGERDIGFTPSAVRLPGLWPRPSDHFSMLDGD